LLDVGAGGGVLVAEAARRGLSAIGVEPSRALAATARSIGANVLQGALPHPDLADATFDVVCFVDVLEHVVNPLRMLRAAASALNPSGVLLVVTPDRGSFAAKLLGRHWWHYRLAHIGYFNETSMRRASALAGLVMVGRSRARWFFTIEYLAARVVRYVPARNLVPATISSRWAKTVLRRVVAVNPHDSMVMVFSRSPQAPAV
jgi:2-polyprenyl-3-methyl-5-hydroxy-6-metoxy-1,4-benzoquinol methylase